MSRIFLGFYVIILFLNCSGSKEGGTLPNNSGLCTYQQRKSDKRVYLQESASPNYWSLYSPLPQEKVLWGSNILDPNFQKGWTINGLLSPPALPDKVNWTGPIADIAQENWAHGMADLQGETFKKSLPKIISYTCYDRKKVDEFGHAINNNCYTEGSGIYLCDVYYSIDCKDCADASQKKQPKAVKCHINTNDADKTKQLNDSKGTHYVAKSACLEEELIPTCTLADKNDMGHHTDCIDSCNSGHIFQGARGCDVYQLSQIPGNEPTPNILFPNDPTVSPLPLPPVIDGCYPDGQGPDPNTKHYAGFYCLGWKSTTYDLTKVNLQLKKPGSGEVLGCMSPGTALSASTQWGGLGIGSTCTHEDPGLTTQIGYAIALPTYLDPVIMYANPYNNDQISGTHPIDNRCNTMGATDCFGTATDNSDQYQIYNAWLGFCQNNKGFCQAPTPGTSTSGLAHLVGQAGPVSTSAYVTTLKKDNPKFYYTWQYDDEAGTIVCKDPGSRVIAHFCDCGGDTMFSENDAINIFKNAPSDRQNSRFAAVNHCPYDIWLQMKEVPTTSMCMSGKFTIGDTTDCLVKVPQGGSYVYNISENGKQSVNIWSKSGCNADGYFCQTGETGKNGGNADKLEYGAQPDLETKVEASFGCTLKCADGTYTPNNCPGRSSCQTAGRNPLIPATFYDVSFVDGYTRSVSLQMLQGPIDAKDTSNGANCKTPPPPKSDISQCPTAADLSTQPYP